MATKVSRTFQGSNITLRGVEYTPEVENYSIEGVSVTSGECLGSVYFLHGLSARWKDYEPLLDPLSENLNIIAYDQRGHGNSPGKFSVEKAADDLEAIIDKEEKRPAAILAHSIGCRVAVDVAYRMFAKGKPLAGIYMIEPCLGIDSFSSGMRALIRTLHYASLPLFPLDWLLNSMSGWRKEHGFHQRYVIQTTGDMANFHSDDCEGFPRSYVGFMLSDNDKVLGTHKQNHYWYCMERLRKLFPYPRHGEPGAPSAWDDSGVVAGLNHCLNKPEDGHVPFLMPSGDENDYQRNKTRDRILDRVHSFFKSVFGPE